MGARKLTGVNAMQVVQIRREAKSLDSAIDVRADVFRGIGDAAIAEAIEVAFGSN